MAILEYVKDSVQAAQVAQINAYYEGIKEGVRMYGWMKDGVTYVGTGGWTLKEELVKIENARANALERLWKSIGSDSDLSRP